MRNASKLDVVLPKPNVFLSELIDNVKLTNFSIC